MPSRFTLHREMNLRITMMKVSMVTNRRAILAGWSRFCVNISRGTPGGTAPDWMAAATSGSMAMAKANLGPAACNFVDEVSHANRRRGTCQRFPSICRGVEGSGEEEGGGGENHEWESPRVVRSIYSKGVVVKDVPL